MKERMHLDVYPTCMDYVALLDLITQRDKITRNEARKKYGLFTYKEWNELLKLEINNEESI